MGQAGSGLVIGLLTLPVVTAFVLCAVGLLRLKEWARWSSLAACSLYFGGMLVNVVGLWIRSGPSRTELTLGVLNGIGAVAVLLWVWWYLTREDVRELFSPGKKGS